MKLNFGDVDITCFAKSHCRPESQGEKMKFRINTGTTTLKFLWKFNLNIQIKTAPLMVTFLQWKFLVLGFWGGG